MRLKRHFKDGITFANNENVKKFIGYREITLAIGILVALVIVLTLLARKPGQPVSGFDRTPHVGTPLSAKNILGAAFTLVKF